MLTREKSMMYTTIFSLMLGLLATCGLQAANPEAELAVIRKRFNGPSVRVQLLQESEGTLVEVKGRYNVFDPYTGKQLDAAYLSSSYYMYPTRDGIKWGTEFPGIYQLLIVPDKYDTTVLIGGTEYHGIVYMYQINNILGAVNETSLDDFVMSVLSMALPTSVKHKEALSAAAIALRTQVIRQIEQNKNAYWEIKAQTFNYRGSSVERKDDAFCHAVRNTKGMIAVKNGLPLDIQWFAVHQPGKAPFSEMEQMAGAGKDARAILETLFPGAAISKVA